MSSIFLRASTATFSFSNIFWMRFSYAVCVFASFDGHVSSPTSLSAASKSSFSNCAFRSARAAASSISRAFFSIFAFASSINFARVAAFVAAPSRERSVGVGVGVDRAIPTTPSGVVVVTCTFPTPAKTTTPHAATPSATVVATRPCPRLFTVRRNSGSPSRGAVVRMIELATDDCLTCRDTRRALQ